MPASLDVGFSTNRASRKHTTSIVPLLQPFMTTPPQMPPVLLIAPNVLGTSSASQLPSADYSSLKSSIPLPLTRQASQGPAPITLVALPPVSPGLTTKPPIAPSRCAALPAGPPSTRRQQHPRRPLPLKPGDPSARPLRRPPRSTVPPRDPLSASSIRGPPRPTVPAPGPLTARPLQGSPKPTAPALGPLTARLLQGPLRATASELRELLAADRKLNPVKRVPPPPIPIPKPKPIYFGPYEKDDLSPIPAMSPGIQREYSMYSDDESLLEVPAPETPPIKFKPPRASSPKAARTMHPDATLVSAFERLNRPVNSDEFFSSNKVMGLDRTNFSRFIKSNEITLVIFYNSNDPESKVHEKMISQAACSTKRTNHAFAAVDCAASSKLCEGNKVTETPLVRLYSRATCLGQLGSFHTVTPDILRQYVELAPSLYSSRMLSCPLVNEQQIT